MSERVVLAQLVLPPSEERCTSGLCAQTACCTLEVRVAGAERENADEEEVYALPSCDAHALHTLTGVLAYARDLFPAELVDVPPWERDEP
jgi:hypothetical protein